MRDLFLAILMICIWGSNYAVAKIGLMDVPPFLFMALRFMLTALILLPFVPRNTKEVGPIFVYAVIIGLIHFGGIFSALALSDAALIIIVSQINVPISIMIAAFFLQEKVSLQQVFGIIVALGGVLIYTGEIDGNSSLAGLIYCLIGAMAWSVGTIWMKTRITVDPLPINFWMAVFATPLLFIAGLIVGEQPWVIVERLTPMAIFSVFYQAVAIVIIGYGIWNYLIKKYDVSSIAPLTLLVPFSGLFFAWLLLGESLSVQEAFGGLLTIAGVSIISVSKDKIKALLWSRKLS